MDRRDGRREAWPIRPWPYPRYDGTQPCREVGADVFVIPGDQHETNRSLKRVCGPCPFLDECREYAISHDVIGVWGGTTYADRRRARQMLKITAIPTSLPSAGSAFAQIRLLDEQYRGLLSARELAVIVGCSSKTVERARAAAA